MTRHGIRFQTQTDFYTVQANSINYFVPQNKVPVLSADGSEIFDIGLLSGKTFSAIAFNIITNRYAAPVVSLYNVGGGLIDAFTLTQGPNTYGFYGATSSIPIASVHYSSENGTYQNTAIANVQLGGAIDPAGAVPEPATWTMLLTGFGAVGAAMRRRQRVALVA